VATRSLEEQRQAFAAEFGSFAPDSLSDGERQFADERAEQLQKDHPPPMRALVIRPNGLVEALAWKVKAVAPRRQATTSRRRPGSRATARAGASRDGPEPSDEPPEQLEHLRPLTAVARAYLRAQVDLRRREVVAARPEVNLFDEDGTA
jgi:hypothetical protein